MIHGLHHELDYGPLYELHYGPRLQIEPRSDARRTNDCYCATAPLDRQTYNGGYILMEVEAPRLWGLQPGFMNRLLCCWGTDKVCWSLLHRWTGQHGLHYPTTPTGEGGAARA